MFSNFKKQARSKTKDQWIEMIKMAIPFIVYGLFYFFWFELLEKNRPVKYTIVHVALDDKIPFLEIFIIPYVMWFGYIAYTAFYLLFRNQKYDYYRCISFLMIGMTAFLVTSTLEPTALQLRPSVMPRDNIFTDMVSRLYAIDTPTNVTPSIHVYNSIGCFLAIHNSKIFHKKGKIISFTLSTLIILSTVFIKQHSIVDVVTAFGLSFIAYILIYRMDLVGILLYGDRHEIRQWFRH